MVSAYLLAIAWSFHVHVIRREETLFHASFVSRDSTLDISETVGCGRVDELVEIFVDRLEEFTQSKIQLSIGSRGRLGRRAFVIVIVGLHNCRTVDIVWRR